MLDTIAQLTFDDFALFQQTTIILKKIGIKKADMRVAYRLFCLEKLSAKTFFEFINATRSVHNALFPCVERVARRTNLNV